GYCRMAAKLLKRTRVDFPSQGGARFGKGSGTVLEHEGELHARVAGLLVKRLPKLMKEGRKFGMLRMQQPDNFSHVRRDLAVERVGFLDVDARTFVADDDVSLSGHHGILG